MDKIDYKLELKPYKYYILSPAPPLSPEQEAGLRHCIALQVCAANFPDRLTLTKMWSPWRPADWHLLRLLDRHHMLGRKISDLMDSEAQNIIGKIGRQERPSMVAVKCPACNVEEYIALSDGHPVCLNCQCAMMVRRAKRRHVL